MAGRRPDSADEPITDCARGSDFPEDVAKDVFFRVEFEPSSSESIQRLPPCLFDVGPDPAYRVRRKAVEFAAEKRRWGRRYAAAQFGDDTSQIGAAEAVNGLPFRIEIRFVVDHALSRDGLEH